MKPTFVHVVHWIVTETESDRRASTVTAGDDRVKSRIRFLRSLVMTGDDRHQLVIPTVQFYTQAK